jgi:hypothetical protein
MLDRGATTRGVRGTKAEIGDTKAEVGETKAEIGDTKAEIGETKAEIGETIRAVIWTRIVGGGGAMWVRVDFRGPRSTLLSC